MAKDLVVGHLKTKFSFDEDQKPWNIMQHQKEKIVRKKRGLLWKLILFSTKKFYLLISQTQIYYFDEKSLLVYPPCKKLDDQNF